MIVVVSVLLIKTDGQCLVNYESRLVLYRNITSVAEAEGKAVRAALDERKDYLIGLVQSMEIVVQDFCKEIDQ